MKMYVGDWLTNASITGYIKIQQVAGHDVKYTQDYAEINVDDLEKFTDRYFTFVLDKYLANSFTLNSKIRNKIEKALDEEHMYEDFKKIHDGLKDRVKLEYDYNDFPKSAKMAKKAIEDFKKYAVKAVTKILKDNKVKDSKINSIKKSINDTFQKKIDDVKSIDTPKFLPNYLKYFYFNKKIIGNYSSKDTYKQFKDEYVQNAITILTNNPQDPNSILCKFCKQNHVVITKFTDLNSLLVEGMFSSVLVSGSKFDNFFYNYQPDVFLCHFCRLLLACTFAGFTDIPIVPHVDINHTDKIFVTAPDLKKTVEQNMIIEKETFEKDSRKFRNTIYKNILSNMLLQYKGKQSEWVLENIMFVELKTVTSKKSDKPDFRYFHISRNIANIINDKFCKISFGFINRTYKLNNVRYNLTAQVMERILYNRSLYDLIDTVFHNKDLFSDLAFNLCIISAIRNLINYKAVNNHEMVKLESKRVYGILKSLQDAGSSFSDIEYKKRKALSYVLLESIRNSDYPKMYDIITKLYLEKEKSIPDNVMLMLNYENPIGTKERAFAFLAGFVSKPKEKEKTDT